MSEREPRARATRADVARLAGVSTAVVSYVVNNGPRPVAPATAHRVKQAMAALRYRPNQMARALKVGTTDTIGYVASDRVSNPFYSALSHAIGVAAAEKGSRILVGHTLGVPLAEGDVVAGLIDRQVDGLIVASAFAANDGFLLDDHRDVPVVLVDVSREIPGRCIPLALTSGRIESLVDHLVGHGRRNIALAVGESYPAVDPASWPSSGPCTPGLPPGAVFHGSWTREGGYAAGQAMLQSETEVDAVVAASDLIAVGLLRAPPRSRPVGCPTTSQSAPSTARLNRVPWPALTVVRQPVTEMAQEAVRQVTSGDPEIGHHVFPLELIIRDSCGC